MAWVKIPPEHHPLFRAALPKDPRVSTLPERPSALALEGAEMFAPMGDGRVSKHSIQLPESVMEETDELRRWLRKAFDHALTLPTKQPKSVKQRKAAAPPANARPAKRAAARTPKQR